MAQGMEVPEIGEGCRGDEFDGIARHVPVCVVVMRQTMRKQQQQQERMRAREGIENDETREHAIWEVADPVVVEVPSGECHTGIMTR